MTSKGQISKSKKSGNYPSFIESLHDLTVGTGKSVGENLVKQVPKDIYRQVGLNNPQPFQGEFAGEDFLEFTERGELHQRIRRVEHIRRQEKTVFSSKEQETKIKISVLYEEVKKLTNANQNLAQEVKIAAFQAPADPGIYHVSFFEKLISFIKDLTKNLEDATSWIAMSNKKGKKRSYYWTQVGKSGGRYMLSQERYMSTQAG